MFDIGGLELCVVAIVALLVVGPEKLPSVLNSFGKWIATVRKMFSNAQQQLNEELQCEQDKKDG